MAELNTLARPYAKAAFAYALAAKDLAAWAGQLAVLAGVSQTENVSKLVGSPSVTTADQAAQIIAVCGDELNEAGRNFVTVLAENKRLGLLPQIYQLFVELKASQEQTVDVEIATAFELDAEIQGKLDSALNKTLNRAIKVSTIVDKSLLGGVVVRAGDVVIDGSVRGRLAKLAESMNL